MSGLEKQNLSPTSAMIPQEAVIPRLHPTRDIELAIVSGNLRSDALLQSFAYFAVEHHWQSVWNLADSLKREVSILFDSQGLIWVDIGTIEWFMFHHRLVQNCLSDFGYILTPGALIGLTRIEEPWLDLQAHWMKRLSWATTTWSVQLVEI